LFRCGRAPSEPLPNPDPTSGDITDEDAEESVAFLQNNVRNGRATTREFDGAIARYLRLDRNASFAENIELSARAAGTLFFFGLPMILGLANDPKSVFHSNPLFNAQACVIFQYTLCKSLGETLEQGFHVLVGSFYATCAANFFYLCFPSGVMSESPGDPGFIFGFVTGCVCVFSTLWFDLSINAQIFMLSNFVFDWMVFFEPAYAS
jgi:hypothetical protein